MDCGARDDGRTIQGYPSRLLPTFAITGLMGVILLAYTIIPRLRRRKLDERFRYYDRLLAWLFLLYLTFQIHALVTGFLLPTYRQILVGVMLWLGVLFFLLGDAFAHAKPGWFVALPHRGAMKHPQVWESTHANAAKWLKRAFPACLPAIVLPFKYAFYASIYIMAACILMVHYYYFIYPHYLQKKLKEADATEDQSSPDENQT